MDDNKQQQLEKEEMKQESRYSLTLAVIQEKLSIHLDDKQSKYIYHDTFTSEELRKCGFSDKQSSNLEKVTKFIEIAKRGHDGIDFSVSIETNQNEEMPDIAVLRISKDDDFFDGMNIAIKLKQIPRDKVEVMQDHINDLKAQTMKQDISIKELKEANQKLQQHVMPKGSIIMWPGTKTDVPNGWALCDGSNGTPDLRNRFIVGACGNLAAKSVGGYASHNHGVTVQAHALTVQQMPNHSHDTDFGQTTLYDGGSIYHDEDGNYMAALHYEPSPYRRSHVSNRVMSSNNKGSGQAHSHQATSSTVSNLPPYFALCFIIKQI